MKHSFLLLTLVISMAASAVNSVSVRDQKILLTRDGQEIVLAPNGQDESYYWVSLSPDGQQILYSTAHHGTFVCDLNGHILRTIGHLNAPKWLDDNNVSGMREHYSPTEHDVVDHVDYYGVDLRSMSRRALTKAETKEFLRLETARQEEYRARSEARAAARRSSLTNPNDLTGLKIYINPGHGGHDGNDRSCWTIPVPETWSNPNGYWESNSNLEKGLALRDLLEAAGATVIMSRVTNNSGSRDREYYPQIAEGTPEYQALMAGDDRELAAIAEEANANNVDHFISIHSNALNGQTNYLLLLYPESYHSDAVRATDIAMATSSGNIQIQNQLTCWTSPKPLLRGDNSFLGYYLGVLYPLTVPGFLSEGSFHDYPPETHRLCNADYCKLEAVRFFQHFHKYFNRTLPQTATISGWVKSSNEKVDVLNQPKFYYVPGTDDQWLPLNGATVILKSEAGVALDTVTTDNWYNGIFAFYDVQPGNYIVEAQLNNYKTVSQTVTVAAEDIACMKIRMKNIHMDVPDYEEPEQDAGTMPLDEYEFEANGTPVSGAAVAFKRIAYKNGNLATLQSDGIVRRNWDFSVIDTLPMPAGLTAADFTDIALSSDGYLVAGKVADNKLNYYAWDDEFLNPAINHTTTEAVSGTPSIAIQGSLWKEQRHYSAAGKLVVTPLAAEALYVDSLGFTPAFFRYAKHSYMVLPQAAQPAGVAFVVYDVTNGLAAAQVVSDTIAVNATATNAAAVAYVDGYTIHIGILATDAQGANASYARYKSIATPVANIYASEVSYDGTNFRFRLNEDATSVSISIEMEGETKDNHNLGAMSKGYHEVANPFGTQGFDGFSVTATARPVGYIVKISNDDPIFQFYTPRGMAVDRNPASPYFGRIYVAESDGGQITEGSPSPARRTSIGVYVLSSDFTDITNQGASSWNGGITWGTNGDSNNQFTLARLGVAPSGKVFLSSSLFTTSGVYVMDPADPSAAFTPVFKGKRNATGQITAPNGRDIVSNPVMSCAVLGTGADERLYTMDRNCSEGTTFCNINQYNIGTLDSLPWKAEPSAVVFDDSQTYYMENGHGEMAYDGHGGWFMAQYRYNSTTAKPALIHVTNGVMDYNCGAEIATCNRGGLGVSVDGSLLAIARETGVVAVYDVEYDANNVPTLTEKYVIDWWTKGYVSAIDFDPAGNLYILSSSNERLMVYSLPKLVNSYTTRITFKQEEESGVKNVKAKDNVRKLVRNGQVLIIKGDRTYNALGVELK